MLFWCSYCSEEWSPDSDYADADAGDGTNTAKTDTDPVNYQPESSHTEDRSPTPTRTLRKTPTDLRRLRVVNATRARSRASSVTSTPPSSASNVTVRTLESGTTEPLPAPPSAVPGACKTPNAETTVPMHYILSSRSPNFMLVIPSSDVAHPNALYRISVNSNCFSPSSYITSIRRGGSEDGELVGDFEYAILAGLE